MLSIIKSFFFPLKSSKIKYLDNIFVINVGATNYYKRSHLFLLAIFTLYCSLFTILLNFLGDYTLDFTTFSSYLGIVLGILPTILIMWNIRRKKYEERGLDDAIINIRFWIISLFGILLVLNIIAIIALYGFESYSPIFYFQSQVIFLTMICILYFVEMKNERVFSIDSSNILIVERLKLLNFLNNQQIVSNNGVYDVALFALHNDIINTHSFSPIDPIHFEKGGIFVVDIDKLDDKNKYIYSLFFINLEFQETSLNEVNFHEVKPFFCEFASYLTYDEYKFLMDKLTNKIRINFRSFQIQWSENELLAK